MKKAKRILALVLAAATAVTCMTGCGKKKTAGIGTNISAEAKQAAKDGKTVIVIPQWPDKDSPDYETMEKARTEFMEQNPDIYIEQSQFKFDFKTFASLAATNELPTMFDTYFTQVNEIIEDGYAADITENLKKIGFYEYINKELLPYTTDKDGNVYALTYSAYHQGLFINKDLFKKAGLVDSEGNVLVPNTYDEVYEYAKQVKEKTGVAGFVFPTAGNVGGWHFINVAWAYGTEFLKKDGDKYTAAFNTKECYEAFEWIRKMRKAELFPTNTGTIAQSNVYEMFGTGQAAMMIADPPCQALPISYNMDPKSFMVASMPAGPKGRYSQLGGDVYMFRSDASDEQIDACLKWLEFRGTTPEITDERAKKIEESNKTVIEKWHAIVLPKPPFSIWSSPERDARIEEIYAKDTNVEPKDYELYYANEGVTIRPEPEVACQELYSILDGVIQAIFADSDADIPALVEEAANKWQSNELNNL